MISDLAPKIKVTSPKAKIFRLLKETINYKLNNAQSIFQIYKKAHYILLK